MPGFGGSEPAAEPRIEDYSETLAGLLDRLEIDACWSAGHSLGGLVSTRFALDHPDRLTGLALVNAGGRGDGAGPARDHRPPFLVCNVVLALPASAASLALRPRLRRLVLAGFLYDRDGFSASSRSKPFRSWPPPASPTPPTRERPGASESSAEQIAAPTLLLWGRARPHHPARARAEELAAVLPDARLEIVDGAGHCPMFECPEEFNRPPRARSRPRFVARPLDRRSRSGLAQPALRP